MHTTCVFDTRYFLRVHTRTIRLGAMVELYVITLILVASEPKEPFILTKK
jgi:hypothetical protein